MKEDNFNFSVPIDIVKSNNENEDEQEWRIGGYASTADEDRQGDEIVQKGLDISDFVNYGFFNLDHRNDVVLGYPDKDKCRIDSHGFYVEGLLLKGVESARHMWEAAVALKKSNAPRKLGFSVEGKQAEIEKALDAGHGDGSCSDLIPESLESAFKTLSYTIGDDEESKKHMTALKQRLNKKTDINKSELTLYFQLTKGLSRADSASLVDKIFTK